MNERCKKLLDSMGERGMDAFLVSSKENCLYLSGFTAGEDATLLIAAGESLLFTDFRYTIQANLQCAGDFRVVEVPRGKDLEYLSDALTSLSCKKVGFEDDRILHREFQRWSALPVELLPASDLIRRQRILKDADEITAIRRAQQASDAAFAELLKILKPGLSEKEVAVELEYLLKKNGADELSFDIIVGSGENGALCHAVPGKRKLANGDFIVFDFGSRVDGYCSDMTRTVALGAPSDKLREIYGIVLEAQLRTLEWVKPGTPLKALDAVARDYITQMGYGECFGHGLGHGFGIEIHEAPTANSRSEEILMPGMTITVEPGIYIEGLGGVRIEDCCVVTEDGHLNLVSTAKDLLVI